LQEYLDVKERTAKGYIKFMREKDIILKDPSKANYFVIGHGNLFNRADSNLIEY
jgi:hypothetical protein